MHGWMNNHVKIMMTKYGLQTKYQSQWNVNKTYVLKSLTYDGEEIGEGQKMA